jgi:triosephosphate isomerase
MRPLVAANWKMQMTQKEGILFLREAVWKEMPGDVEVSVHPSAAHLWVLREMVGNRGMVLGAQDCHWELRGAFTGEISALMLKEIGVEIVILGHSERRKYFGETDERVNRKLKRVLGEGLRVIVCVGESLEEREEGRVFEVLRRQWEMGLDGVGGSDAGRIAVAYEPVWAIGTGRNADAEAVSEVAGFLKERAQRQWGADGDLVRILYGGSVTPENAGEYARIPEIRGALVGGASTNAQSFYQIIRAFSETCDSASG